MSGLATLAEPQSASTAASLLDPRVGILEARPQPNLLHRMIGWLRTRIRYWSTLRELELLDDRTLADLGMYRMDLAEIACRLSRPGQQR